MSSTYTFKKGDVYTVLELDIGPALYDEAAVRICHGMSKEGFTLGEHSTLGTVLIPPRPDLTLYVVPPEFLRWLVEQDYIHLATGPTSHTRN